MKFRRIIQSGFFVGAIAVSLTGCSSGLTLQSDWDNGTTKIDGSDADWQRGLYYCEESDFMYGIRNDAEYLYVFLKTQNRTTQRQIMGGGFTVWFDPEGGKSEALGIHYPIEPEHQTAEDMTTQDNIAPEFELVGKNTEDHQRCSVIGTPGIKIALHRTLRGLVYELSIPLKKTSQHPYAINILPHQRLGVGFENSGTSRPEHSMERRQRDASNDSQEQSPEQDNWNNGEQREGRQEMRGSRAEGSSQLDLWLSVQLAGS